MVSSMGQQVEHRNQSSWNEPFCNEKSFQNIEQIVTDTSQIGRQKDNIKKEKNVSRIMDKKLNSPKKKRK